jgi:hypothetical protein
MTSVVRPTTEMQAFFARRTKEHIERVRQCIFLIADKTPYADELRQRAAVHDDSKFSDAEREPYTWLTEYYRCRRVNEPFSYPPGVTDLVRLAIEHHVTSNRHHPDFHSDPNEMSDVDLIEMVCDWTAMSIEFGQDEGSARGWADKTIGDRVLFNPERRAFVYQTIDLLDSVRLATGRSAARGDDPDSLRENFEGKF